MTQKAYNGVAVLPRSPINAVSNILAGVNVDAHARFLQVIIKDVRVVNIYMQNGNPIGTEKFEFELDWMDRLRGQMERRLTNNTPTIVGATSTSSLKTLIARNLHHGSGTLFSVEPRARYRGLLDLGYIDAFRSLHPDESGQFTFWDYFWQAFEHNRGIRIHHFLLSPNLRCRLKSCEIDKGPRSLSKPSDQTPIVLSLHR